jgi:hypothetical protein
MISDVDSDGNNELISNIKGEVSIYRQGKKIAAWKPYDDKFKKDIFVAVGDVDGDGKKEIITGPGAGGGPHIRIFTSAGKLKSGFFAYDSKFRGGVSVAVGDVDGDGKKEIITGAGAGGGPEVRVFDNKGKLENKFMAYETTYKGGVQVMASDINNDNTDEIMAGNSGF